MITHSLEDLISTASKKFGILVKRIFTVEGGEIDDIDLIRCSAARCVLVKKKTVSYNVCIIFFFRDNDVLCVSAGEPFIRLESKKYSLKYAFPCATEGEWITLNVGGEYFITSRSTLVMKEPNSVLAR